ncbi:hypothetical protein EDEG_02125 [Edhazardia aedis USNM 41457]|uniref:Uncharacterized protein n=1 Tax=Edhazardia aedis (strain USNM 41457) TaxID=1003232 RepID=J9D708_EDHAE|nr:hypothetical protein EDEG_02125 [Edhazardia aedis USNM 41457]|eukprot:EJW03541.1 hypothetical protein EDEG_02125 [Edhazardia aedis USNM 41457]
MRAIVLYSAFLALAFHAENPTAEEANNPQENSENPENSKNPENPDGEKKPEEEEKKPEEEEKKEEEGEGEGEGEGEEGEEGEKGEKSAEEQVQTGQKLVTKYAFVLSSEPESSEALSDIYASLNKKLAEKNAQDVVPKEVTIQFIQISNFLLNIIEEVLNEYVDEDKKAEILDKILEKVQTVNSQAEEGLEKEDLQPTDSYNYAIFDLIARNYQSKIVVMKDGGNGEEKEEGGEEGAEAEKTE